jgi:hypothetical protein
MKLLDMYRTWRLARRAAQQPAPAAQPGSGPAAAPVTAPAAPAPAAPAPAAPAPPAAGGSPVDGRWRCTMDTPMGEQTVLLTLATADGVLSGDAQSPFGAQSFTGGTVRGRALTWSISVTEPMAVELGFRATIEGDRLDGVVDTGLFGEQSFSGTRQ